MQNLCLGRKCKSEYNEAMANGVYLILSEVLGGMNYVQSSTYSQHHYYIGQYTSVSIFLLTVTFILCM